MTTALDWRTHFGFDLTTRTYVPGWFVHWLPGNEDIITVTVEPATVLSDVQLLLRSESREPAVTWWKGLKIIDPIVPRSCCQAPPAFGTSETQDSVHEGAVLRLDPADTNDKFVEFAKAKFLNVRTPMYRLPLAEVAAYAGYRFIFSWFRDRFS